MVKLDRSYLGRSTLAADPGDLGWGFWLRWVLANVVGLALGQGLLDLFAGACMSEGGNFLAPVCTRIVTGEGALMALVFGGHWLGYILAGAVTALAQWLVFRHTVQQSGWVNLRITLAPVLTFISLVVVFFAIMGIVAGTAGGGSSASPEGGDPFVIEFVVTILGSLVLGVAAGGIARWLIVRRPIGWAGWGVLASSVAFALGFNGGYAVGPLGTLVVPAALVGLASGISQWRALRGHVSGAGWWVLANTLGLAAGAAAGGAVLFWLGSTLGMWIYGAVSTVTFALYGAAAGAAGGAITGAVLVRLLRRTISEPAEEALPASA